MVTSFAEVWIEICQRQKLPVPIWSLPSRKCGLKYIKGVDVTCGTVSLSLRRYGLKLCQHDALGMVDYGYILIDKILGFIKNVFAKTVNFTRDWKRSFVCGATEI